MPKFNFHLHELKVKQLLTKLWLPIALIVILFLIDISFDIRERINLGHLAIEFLIYLVIIYIAYIGYGFYTLDKKALMRSKKTSLNTPPNLNIGKIKTRHLLTAYLSKFTSSSSNGA